MKINLESILKVYFRVMNNKILIIISHPDDEILWMWWTIQKRIKEKFLVDILLLSKPWNARETNENDRLVDFKKVCDSLWINKIFYETFPDTSFDTIKFLNIVKSIEKVLDISKPDIVYTHYYNDLNIDHCITSKASLTALRPIERFNFVKKIFLFEILSSTELWIWNDKFSPNYYEDISNNIEEKVKLFNLYKSEVKKFPHPRCSEWIKTLAKYRWMESWLEYAEAFMLYRSIN